MINLIIQKIPEEFNYGIVLNGNDLYITNEFKKEFKILSFISYAKKINSNIVVHWKTLTDITELKETVIITQDTNSSNIKIESSDVEKYGIDLFRVAHEQKVSDIHIIYYKDRGEILFRKFGGIVPYIKLGPEFCLRLMTAIFQTMGQASNSPTFTINSRLDAKISDTKYLPSNLSGIRIHAEPMDCKLGKGSKMVLRLLSEIKIGDEGLEKSLLNLGYSFNATKQIMQMTMRSGICIFAGPTNSGKSTSLGYVFGNMKKDFPDKVFISIEDPPEYFIEGVQQIAITETDPQKKYQSYMDAIGGSLRSDPDVLMLGEIRYPEAADNAITAVNTGHGLWATVHASSSFNVITRLEGLLAKTKTYDLDVLCDTEVLSGIIYQRLVPKICPDCKINLLEAIKGKKITNKNISKSLLKQLQKISAIDDSKRIEDIFIKGFGCKNCMNGYSGQKVNAEVILTDQIFLDLIKNKEKNKAIMYWKDKLHGQTYIEHAINDIYNGIIDPQVTIERLKSNLIELEE